MKFLRVNDRWINADEIQTVEVRKCYKEKYYIREYYQAVLITKYDSEYILYEHEDKGKVLDYIVLRLVKNFVFPIYNVNCRVGLCC